MDWYTLFHTLVGLPALIIGSLLLALIIHIRWPRLGITLIWLTTFAFLALSIPATAHRLLHGLEIYPAVKNPSPRAAQAIVVLGGGRDVNAPEFGGDSVSSASLERLYYAAYLHRRTGLPLMLVGGSTFQEPLPEAELMKTVLTRDFGVPVKWTETNSRTTFENALNTRRILAKAGIKTVYLVTHAWHMRRAVMAFSVAGLDVIPAGHGYSTVSPYGPAFSRYLPSIDALRDSSRAVHEYIGYYWYRHRIARGDLNRS